MRWQYKAAAQKLLSELPGGEYLNYLLARHVTKTAIPNDSAFLHDVRYAMHYLNAFRAFGKKPIEHAAFYEFGAGWDLIVALTVYANGVERQSLIDIRRLLRPGLVDLTTARLNRLLSGGCTRPVKRLGRVENPRESTNCCGQTMEFATVLLLMRAKTGWKNGSVNYVSATKVLQHVPLNELSELSKECVRLLTDDGIALFMIDYRDQYSYFDCRVSPYNFLRFSDQQWAKCNSRLQYQNRLRHSDYRELFARCGFDIIEELRASPDARMMNEGASLPIETKFSRHEHEDLFTPGGEFVLRKSSRHPIVPQRSAAGLEIGASS